MEIGTALEQALRLRNMQRKELAHQLGINRHYVDGLCTNHKKAGTGMIQRICDILDYKVSEFLALGEE